MKKVVGIDVSKLSIDINYKDEQGQIQRANLSNDEVGFEKLISQVNQGYYFVMEATGAYHYQLACFLYAHSQQVSVINPLVAKRFCQMRFQRNKTDESDALSLREYGETQPLENWKPCSHNDIKIKHLYGNMKRLIGNQTALSNQLHAYDVTGELASDVRAMMETELQSLKDRIEQLENELTHLIQQSYPQAYDGIRTIPGIGPKSAVLLLVVCKGFKNFQNAKQVIAYLGTSPRTYQSGTSVNGKAKICKLGMSKVRATLYVAARSAIRYNQMCQLLYQRLTANGKPHKVAMIAVVNKLIKQVFAIVKSGITYQTDHIPVLK